MYDIGKGLGNNQIKKKRNTYQLILNSNETILTIYKFKKTKMETIE